MPQEIRQFFGVQSLNKGEEHNIYLIHNDLKYEARIEMDNLDSPRTRLFWKKDFVNLIETALPDWLGYFKNGSQDHEDPPQLRLEKSLEQEDTYFVDFINPIDIELDIEVEVGQDYETLAEGAVKYYYGKKYERKLENRKRAIEIHGLVCAICGFDFEKIYGTRGKGFIEIHHTKPLSTLGQEKNIDPLTDLIPVCSNCHRMIHRRTDEVLSIEEMKMIVCKR